MKKPAALAKDAQVRGRGALSVPTSPGEEHWLEDTMGPSRPGDTAVPARAALAYLRDDRVGEQQLRAQLKTSHTPCPGENTQTFHVRP